ncbi:MAG: hypothetical protein RR182_01120 [Alistipes sp.]
MNLIEKLGGYTEAKRAVENDVLEQFAPYTHETARKELLEYRREHKIYEVGDYVLTIDACFSVEPLKLVEYCGSEFKYTFPGHFGYILKSKMSTAWRHATDAEIEANKRLPHVGDTVSYGAYFCGEFETGRGKITQIDKDYITLDNHMIVDISEIVQ